jgi:hypothetical protein
MKSKVFVFNFSSIGNRSQRCFILDTSAWVNLAQRRRSSIRRYVDAFGPNIHPDSGISFL